MQDQISIN